MASIWGCLSAALLLTGCNLLWDPDALTFVAPGETAAEGGSGGAPSPPGSGGAAPDTPGVPLPPGDPTADGEHEASWTFGAVDGIQYGVGVAIDSSGATVVAAKLQGGADVAGHVIDMGYGAFVSKLAAGAHVWSAVFEAAEVHDLCVAGDDGVILVGTALGGEVDIIDANGATTSVVSAGPRGILVAKLAADGALRWVRLLGGQQADRATRCAVDGEDVLVAGELTGVVTFAPGIVLAAGDADVFAARLDGDGNALWARGFASPLYDYATGLATDAAGHAFVVGSINDFMGAQVTKLDAAGDELWTRSFACSTPHWQMQVATDTKGHAILAGHFDGTLTFDVEDGLLVSQDEDIFVAALDPEGETLWARRHGGPLYQQVRDVAVDPWGNIALTGSFNGELPLDEAQVLLAHGEDLYVMKLGADGLARWGHAIGDAEDQAGAAIAVGADGRIAVTGMMFGVADFGGGEVSALGPMGDAFLARFFP